MKGFCPLASGSKGNALYLGTDQTKLLIDVGISYRALQQRLAEIDVSIEEIDAVLISHEHSDHVRGLEKLCSSLKIPVFANSETAKAILSNMKMMPRFKIFSTGEPFEFGDMQIHPFSVQHDTLDPVAFTFQFMGMKVGICTDLGYVTTLVTAHLRDCDYLYVEANHEPSMVYACPRPPIYKQRVLGRQGHLSNEMCADLLKEIKHPGLKHVYLAHLSEECNNPELALKKVREHLEEEVGLSIAYQEKISEKIFF
ncbi:MBL fold metallo-hydrolase [Simkania sp.]|uniref:MBL fold metallo-hydrolase n=1 Tax=Simkania sp. TaxID=34094 RepID=UPI003B520B57